MDPQKEFNILVANWQEGELSPDGEQRLAAFLDTNPELTEELADLSEIHTLLDLHHRPHLHKRVMKTLKKSEDRTSATRSPRTTATRQFRQIQPAPKKRYKVVLAAAATIAIIGTFAAIALVSSQDANPSLGSVVRVSETMTATRQGQQIDVQPGFQIQPNDQFMTQGSGSRLSLADGTTLDLAGQTMFQLQRNEQGIVAQLADGALYADVAKQPADQPLRFNLPHMNIDVLGTKFHLSTSHYLDHLQMVEGKVRVQSVDAPQQQQILVTGQVTHGDQQGLGTVVSTLDPGFQLWLPFNDDDVMLRNISGKALVPTIQGKIAIAPGKHGGGAQFNGIGGIRIDQLPQSTRWTISCWLNLKRGESAVKDEVIVAFLDSEHAFQTCALTLHKGKELKLNLMKHKLESHAVVGDGWQHLAFTFESGKQMELFINGQRAVEEDDDDKKKRRKRGKKDDDDVDDNGETLGLARIKTFDPAAMTSLVIGGHLGQQKVKPLRGGMDDLRIYTRILSAKEIARLAADPK
ncbi:hypothetical protein BVY04_02920 [bacterium M21]|nr:hypothetical protein BVY04_02920 [bacterium M21]